MFGFFAGMDLQGKGAGLVNRIGPYTLGVYLLHENLGFRYTWQSWLGAGKVAGAMNEGGIWAAVVLIFWTAAAVICVFVCGILVDIVRKWVFGILHKAALHLGIYRRMLGTVEKADELFAIKRESRE